MKHKYRVKAALLVGMMGLSLLGCDGMQARRQDIGTLTGGVLGGLLGGQVGKGSGRVAAVIGGTIIGGMMGSEVGRSIDDTNRMRIAHALETTPKQRSRSWVDHDRRYTVTPEKSYHKGANICRHYRVSIEMDNGHIHQGHGKACRDDQGNWVVQESWSDR